MRGKDNWPKIFISCVAVAALALVVLRGVEVQAGILILVIVAVLPWLASSIELVEFPGGGSVRLREVQAKVAEQEQKLDRQQDIIVQLVLYSMSWYVFTMLSQLYHRSRSGEEYLFRDNDAMPRDLRFLRDHGYLEHFNIAELRDSENLIGKVRLTPIGNFFVELREQLQAQQATESAKQLGSRGPGVSSI
ncbi:MAG TPA: hypothetical protein VJT72_16735 [Pseudonocardiaceae bacterium]|nr:hypothetical protein [Pseudonocardiaceae bacterium]